MDDTFVILDQAAGQKQIEILDVFRKKYKNQAIISGNINEREKKLGSNVIWEKTIKYNRKNYITRFWTWFVFTIQAYWIVKRKYKNAHLFIITNPPTSIFLTLFLKNKYSILVFDLYPDTFAEYKMLSENNFFYRKWASLNVKIFNRAERIYTLGEGMASRLCKYIDRSRIEVVELWTDSQFLVKTDVSDNWFVKKHGLEGKFVVMYSGNMGLTHPVELILEIAQKLHNINDIIFVLIGGGHKYKLIQSLIAEKKLDNVLLMPFLDTKDLPFSFNAAHVGIVTLDSQAGQLSVPSKVFDQFAVGKPVLGIGSESSELSRLLHTYNCGQCFNEDNLEGMTSLLLKLQNDRNYYEQLSKNSLIGATHHTPANAEKFL